MKSLFFVLITAVFFGSSLYGQQDSLKVGRLNQDKLQELSNDIITEQTRLKEKLKYLEENMQATDNLRDILVEANEICFDSYVKTLSNRYDAGQEILHHIITETNLFNLSFSQLALQAQFSKLIDPTTYSEFNTAVNSTLTLLGDRKPFPTVVDINILKDEIPILNNPIISTGFSIASFFLAKYHKRKDLESQSLKSMSCVLSFTNVTKKDYDILISQLNFLTKRLDDFNSASKLFFTSYLNEVSFQPGYTENYPDQIDVVSERKNSFFSSLRNDKEEIGILSYESNKDDKITYQIEQVKFWMNEYELLLLEINGFISNYRTFVEETQQRGQSMCENLSSETTNIFTEIANLLDAVEANFNTVYVENRIPTPTKRNLFGFN